MQGILKTTSEATPTVHKPKSDKYQNVPQTAPSPNARLKLRTSKSTTSPSPPKQKDAAPKIKSRRRTREHQIQTASRGWKSLNCSSLDEDLFNNDQDEKVTHRSVQTESTSDLNKLYQSGVIKYPTRFKKRVDGGDGDHVDVRRSTASPTRARRASPTPEENLCSELGSARISDKQHDFIRENAQAVKLRAKAAREVRDPNKAPPEYKKGVIPKYIQERKGPETCEPEAICPQGHILLPEEERKETLRVLRQSYAERVQELNGMPVKTDTLRQRKRKMAIEEELKKIDEGIKVFQRPKVYVKIND